MPSSADSDAYSFSSSSESSGQRKWKSKDAAKDAEKHQKKMMKEAKKQEKRALKDAKKQQRAAIRDAKKQWKADEKNQRKARLGHAMFVTAFESQPLSHASAQPVATSRTMQVMRTHDIDETRPDYFAHGIIRVQQGELVELLDGSLENGLPAPYSDYVLVRTAGGKVGKVGKLCFF